MAIVLRRCLFLTLVNVGLTAELSFVAEVSLLQMVVRLWGHGFEDKSVLDRYCSSKLRQAANLPPSWQMYCIGSKLASKAIIPAKALVQHQHQRLLYINGPPRGASSDPDMRYFATATCIAMEFYQTLHRSAWSLCWWRHPAFASKSTLMHTYTSPSTAFAHM